MLAFPHAERPTIAREPLSYCALQRRLAGDGRESGGIPRIFFSTKGGALRKRVKTWPSQLETLFLATRHPLVPYVVHIPVSVSETSCHRESCLNGAGPLPNFIFVPPSHRALVIPGTDHHAASCAHTHALSLSTVSTAYAACLSLFSLDALLFTATRQHVSLVATMVSFFGLKLGGDKKKYGLSCRATLCMAT